MAEQKWTTKLVADRLDEAAMTMRRLPGVTLKGCRAFWPDIIHEFSEAYGWNEARVRLGPPSAEAISRMDESLDWLRWLEPEQTRLVWMRAEHLPWKLITTRLGCDRTTAWRKLNVALQLIVSRLNAPQKKILQHKIA